MTPNEKSTLDVEKAATVTDEEVPVIIIEDGPTLDTLIKQRI